MMYEFYREIMLAAGELNYVLEYKDGYLGIVQKPACTCMTNHAKNLNELFYRYFEYFKLLDNGDNAAQKIINDWAEKLNISIDTLIPDVEKLYIIARQEWPEKFI
jgi:predicted NBD/HSP70 family sugar kinase